MQPTASELTLLRQQPHRTKFYLSIYKPDTVFSCQVDDATITKGTRRIYFDNVTFGTHTDVKHGMTMYVGTTPGAKDGGEVYIRWANVDNLVVGENSHINWEDDLYLTVVNFFQIWPLFPRYTGNDENITVYKDYDIEYTDENENLGALLCMGSHHAGFLDGGSHEVYFSATGTVHMKGASMSYHWLFPGGDPTGSSLHTPGNVTYTSAGHYTAELMVSGTSNGSREFGYRHISIYDRPGEGDNVPILSWGFDSELSGDRDAGGYSVDLWVKENIDDVEDGALVIIFSENWYGSTKQNIRGGVSDNNKDGIVFIGYVLGDTISYDYQDSMVNFRVSSPTELMKQVESFSVSVEDSTNPTEDAAQKGGDPWFYLVGLTVQTALYHYMRWHTTISRCCDVQYNATDFNLQFFDADRTSLYDALNQLMEKAVMGKAVCDRYGKLWFEIEYEALDTPTNLQQDMFLDNQDWMGQLEITERKVKDLSFLETGGVYWQGAVADTFTPIISAAPGSVPAYRGTQSRLSGLALSSQAQSNKLCGNVYANRNSRFPDVTAQLVGNYYNLDIAPQAAVTLTDQNRTFRQLNWEQKPFAIRRMIWRLDTEKQFANPTVGLTELVDGYDADTGYSADTIDVPAEPPSSGYVPPQIPIPALPTLPVIEFPSPTTGVGGFLLRSANMTQNINDVYVTFTYIGDSQGITSDSTGFTVTEAGLYHISWGCLVERDGTSGIGHLDLVLYADGFRDTVWGYWSVAELRDETMSRSWMQERAVGDRIRVYLDNQPTNTDIGNIFLLVHKV